MAKNDKHRVNESKRLNEAKAVGGKFKVGQRVLPSKSSSNVMTITGFDRVEYMGKMKTFADGKDDEGRKMRRPLNTLVPINESSLGAAVKRNRKAAERNVKRAKRWMKQTGKDVAAAKREFDLGSLPKDLEKMLNETSYDSDMDNNSPVIVQGVKGMKSKPFRKKFRNMAAFDKWTDSDAAGDFEVHQVTNESKQLNENLRNARLDRENIVIPEDNGAVKFARQYTAGMKGDYRDGGPTDKDTVNSDKFHTVYDTEYVNSGFAGSGTKNYINRRTGETFRVTVEPNGRGFYGSNHYVFSENNTTDSNDTDDTAKKNESHAIKVTEGVLDQLDDEGVMVKRQLYDTAKRAIELHKIVQDTDQIESWVQKKITLAADYIDTVYHYMSYDEQMDAEAMAADISLDDVASAAEMLDLDFIEPAIDQRGIVNFPRETQERYAKMMGEMNTAIAEGNPCWDGYEKVAGKKDYEKGSCRKKTANESGIDGKSYGDYVEDLDLIISSEDRDAFDTILNKYLGNDDSDDYLKAMVNRLDDRTARRLIQDLHLLSYDNELEENKGLYYNVNKRKKAGTSRPKGHPKAPTDQDWKNAAKGTKESVCEEVTLEDNQDFHEEYGYLAYSIDENNLFEAEYQGRKVKLNKPTRGDVKKFKVYVKNDKGNIVKVNFGQKGMRIKKSNPGARKSFRARHNCDNPGPKWKARYWSCRKW